MRTLLFCAALLPGLFLSGSALAADACDDPQDQMTMNECADKAFRAADAQLNASYREIVASLRDDPDGRQHLVAAQRAWVAFRDAECAFRASPEQGGSIYPLVHSDCLTALTDARIADFKEYLSCEEGDLACPVPAGQ